MRIKIIMKSKKKNNRKNDISRYQINNFVANNLNKETNSDNIVSKQNSNTIELSNKSEVEIKTETIDRKFNLKSPILSFLGHVDAGKTSLMDAIRNSKKADNESGGITQSIGSYYVSIDDIEKISKSIKDKKFLIDNDIPGFLVIDTPGHEAFSSMRDRGSSLCDIAILLVDINEGLQQQSKESIELLKSKNIPFIIAANKLDLIDEWEVSDEYNLRKSLKSQSEIARNNLMVKIEDLKYELSQMDVRADLYFNNEKNLGKIYSIVPVSTKSKEGLSDLLNLISFITQNCMKKKISIKDKFTATVMEYNLDKDKGHNIDIILSNGTLSKGDKIVVITSEEPKICTIRNIFVESFNDSKKKLELVSKNSIEGSCGAKIIGSNLENCITGSSIYYIDPSDDFDGTYKLEQASTEYNKFWNSFSWNTNGVYLIAPKIGEFDAAYNILKKEKIPIIGGSITSLTKKSLERFSSMIEDEDKDEYRILLSFGKIEKKSSLPFTKNKNEFEEFDDSTIKSLDHNILMMQNDVIYKLIDSYKLKSKEIIDKRKIELSKKGDIAFPCKLLILKNHVYMKGGTDGDDFLFGVKVIDGKLKIGTPLVTEGNEKQQIGEVTSIKKNEKNLDEALINDEVCIRITNPKYILYGRHFNFKDIIYSNLSREIIDKLKLDFRKDLTNKDWELVKEIVLKFNIKK